MGLNEDDQARLEYRDVFDIGPVNPGESHVKTAKEQGARIRENSGLNWNSDEAEALLKHYSIELLDRLGRSASMGLEVQGDIKIDGVYAKIEVEDEKWRLTIENEFGISGIQVYQDTGDLEFEEYIAEKGGKINYDVDDPENKVFADILSEEVEFDDFFEGFTVQETRLTYRTEEVSTTYL